MECCCWSITTCAYFPSLAKLYCLSSTRPHNLSIFKAFPYMFFPLGHPSEFWKFPISNCGYGKNVSFRMVSSANCSTRNFYCVFTVCSVACHTVSKSLIKDSPLLEAGIKILTTWFSSTRDCVFNYYNQIPIACHAINDKQREQRLEW